MCFALLRYADIYTSRVSNFVPYTPYMHFKGPRQSLAHDMDLLNHVAVIPIADGPSVL